MRPAWAVGVCAGMVVALLLLGWWGWRQGGLALMQLGMGQC
ncbi:hypothetical protein [Pseudomonas phoenicis]